MKNGGAGEEVGVKENFSRKLVRRRDSNWRGMAEEENRCAQSGW